MKVVFLAAGMGRRLKNLTKSNHKALINIDDKSLLFHLIENFIYAGLDDFVAIVGHCKEKIINEFNKNFSKKICKTFICNPDYNKTNNLYSLYCAKDLLNGQDFILCNADIVLDRRIIKDIYNKHNKSAIVIDDFDYKKPLDSPGVLLQNGIIADLGRHINFENKNGYAIGVYKFTKELSSAFFDETELIIKKDINAGFHDPLRNLFSKFMIYPSTTKQLLWTDIDEYNDIKKAKLIHNEVKKTKQ